MAEKPAPKKIVLAYSGGLDTSVAVAWLKEQYGAEVVTLTVDLGGGSIREGVDRRAMSAGASKAYVVDAKETFVSQYVWRALQAGAIYQGAYPLATALAAAVLSGIRPPRRFWLYACSGTLIVLLYSLWQSGAAGLYVGDLALAGAVLLGAIGYAKGAELSQQMPGWQVISWVVVLSLPVSLPWSVWVYTPGSLSQLPTIGWSALLYIGLVSSLLGFFAWNKALALGGVARISQVQLLQPFLTYGYSIVLLGESWNWLTAIVCALVIGVVWLSKRQP